MILLFQKHYFSILVFICVLSFPMNSAFAGTRIQENDLTYLGTIDITHNDANCGSSPNARGTGLTLNPEGNGGAGSFYISGRTDTHCVAEITKPEIGETATFLQNYTDVTNGTWSQVGDCYNGCFIGGHLVYNDNLYLTVFSYYDANFSANKSIWRHSLTLNDHSGMVGPVAAGPGNQGMYNQYMDNVPSELQSALGGPAVIGGCCFSIISRTSLGPALYSFDPENLGTLTPLVGYPDGHRTLNEWAAPGSHPEANPTTKMSDVSFIEGTDTVLFIGQTGKGEYCYGTGEACGDPQYPYSGTHAYPYVHYMWAYDVDDLAATAAGSQEMWDVMPYAHWEMPSLGNLTDEWSVTGMAFDPEENLLYVLKNRDDTGAWPQLYVYEVNLIPDTTPPTSPTNLAANATSENQITVSWNASTDNIGVDHYEVERCLGLSCSNFANVGSPNNSPFNDSGLSPSTGYSYHVRAVDAAGNTSGWSNVVGATTMDPDTTPPTPPTNLEASADASSRISLSWTASTDDREMDIYRIEQCQGASCSNFSEIDTTSETTYQATNLIPETTYRYRVRATDAAGNLSPYSSIASATTPEAPPISPDLVAAYNFDENSGSTLTDLTENNHDGTIQGATWSTEGKYDNTLDFDGTNDSVDIGNWSISGSALTISAWVNADDWKANDVRILSKASDSTEQGHTWMISDSDSYLRFRLKTDGTTDTLIASSTTLPTNEWVHIAAVYDGSTMKLYQDGTEVGSMAKTGTLDQNTQPITIGMNPDGTGSNHFDGTIDDLRIYNTALTQQEIQDDMDNPLGGGGSQQQDTEPPTSPTNLAADATSESEIAISWTAATDNIGVVRYEVERCLGLSCSNFSQVGTPTNSLFNDSGLSPSTGYSYHVRAVDAAGNTSGWSNVVGATTMDPNTVTHVYNLTQLYAAFSDEVAGETIIIHPDGSPYTLNSTALEINAPNVTVQGSTGNRDDVIIQGDAMSSSALIKIGFYINIDAADNITIKDLSVGRFGWHGIKFSGENNAGDGSIIDNVRIFDTYEQMIKASDNNNGESTDNVTVQNSLFEYTAGIGPQYYIGGIDAHVSDGWIVRSNTFRNIQSPDGNVAEHAIHFWDGDVQTGSQIIEKNLIINCDRGIGLWNADGGIIRNNMILHDGSGAHPDVAIDIQDTPNVQIDNNTSWIAASGYYTNIELRGAASVNILVRNNLVNKGISNINASSPTFTSNITNAQASWFVDVDSDLHLASSVASVVDQGLQISGLTDDIDGDSRPQGGGIDIGADEYEFQAPTLISDFNGDDIVNIFDYNILLSNFGTTSDCDNPADANEDCTVNIFDYNILLGEFGQSI
jgi:chitodextrinase